MEHGRGDTPSPHQCPRPHSGEHVGASGPPESGVVSSSVAFPLPTYADVLCATAGSHSAMRPRLPRPPEGAADRQRSDLQARAVRGGLPGKAGGRPGVCGCDKGCRIGRWREKSRGNPLPTTLCPGHFRISHLFPTAVFHLQPAPPHHHLSSHHVRVPPCCSSRSTHPSLTLQFPPYISSSLTQFQ